MKKECHYRDFPYVYQQYGKSVSPPHCWQGILQGHSHALAIDWHRLREDISTVSEGLNRKIPHSSVTVISPILVFNFHTLWLPYDIEIVNRTPAAAASILKTILAQSSEMLLLLLPIGI